MKLFIARHGQASYEASSDHERPLTDVGRFQTEALVQEYLDEFSGVDAIWCSDLTRARQTAEIYERALNLKPEIKPFISPDGDVAKVIKALSKSSGHSLLMVSHQPLVGELVSMLVEGNVYQSHPFTTSEVVVLEMDECAAGLASMVKDFIPV